MNKTKVSVVIPAAGVGSRVGADTPKQYIPLLGKAMLARTIESFLASDVVDVVMVALSPSDCFWQSLSVFNDDRVFTCEGGANRADSVLAGLTQLNAADDTWVLVHDAARPCITPKAINSMVEQLAGSTCGGLFAIPVADTLKYATDQRLSESTIDRSRVWRAQTPQMFRLGMLSDALIAAAAKGLTVTDEASAIELAGYQPRLIQGYAENIKVTYPADVALAEFYLQLLKIA